MALATSASVVGEAKKLSAERRSQSAKAATTICRSSTSLSAVIAMELGLGSSSLRQSRAMRRIDPSPSVGAFNLRRASANVASTSHEATRRRLIASACTEVSSALTISRLPSTCTRSSGTFARKKNGAIRGAASEVVLAQSPFLPVYQTGVPGGNENRRMISNLLIYHTPAKTWWSRGGSNP
jgi:hypothetical protein